MNSYQLTLAMLKNQFTKKYFIGVFARDELPLKVKFPSCFIVNTHNRNQFGEHWLAFFIDQDGSVEFFDSYGFSPKFYNLDKYIVKINKNKIKYSKNQLQGFDSKFCGVYCVFFLYERCKGTPFSLFFDNLKKFDNLDDFIKKFIKNSL